nr:tetratricopeptide repeat protein [Gammaproteobacteria bacterium]
SIEPSMSNRDWALSEVIALLRRGERDKAKLALAKVLAKSRNDPGALELAGVLLLEEQKVPAAQESFKRSIAAQPNRASALAKLGVTFLLQGDAKTGEQALRQALTIQPYEPLALRYMAWLAETNGDASNGIAYLERTLQNGGVSHNTLSGTHTSLARLYNALGRYASAYNLLGPLFEHTTKDNRYAADAMVALGVAALEIGDVSGAKRAVKKLKTLVPTAQPELRILEASVARAEKKYTRSTELLRAVVKDSPQYSTEAYHALGRTYVAMNKGAKAAKALRMALKHASDEHVLPALRDLVALLLDKHRAGEAIAVVDEYTAKLDGAPSVAYLRAEIEFVTRQLGPAAKTAQRIMVDSPEFIPAYVMASRLVHQTNGADAAEAILKQAVTKNPTATDAWLELARHHRVIKAPSEAERVLREAHKANPNNTRLQVALADALNDNGETTAANQHYRAALVRQPTNAPVIQKLVNNLAGEEKGTEEAARIAARAYQYQQDVPTVQDAYGWALLNTGKIDEALPLLKSASAHLPHNALAQYHIGVAMLKSGDAAAAKTHLNRALDLGVNDQLLDIITAYLDE